MSRTWQRVTSSEVRIGLLAIMVIAAVIAGVTYFYLSPPNRQTVSFTTRDGASLQAGQDVREFLGKQGMIVAGGSAADFKAQIAADYQTRGRIIRELNIAAE